MPCYFQRFFVSFVVELRVSYISGLLRPARAMRQCSQLAPRVETLSRSERATLAAQESITRHSRVVILAKHRPPRGDCLDVRSHPWFLALHSPLAARPTPRASPR